MISILSNYDCITIVDCKSPVKSDSINKINKQVMYNSKFSKLQIQSNYIQCNIIIIINFVSWI